MPDENDCSLMATVVTEPKTTAFDDCSKIHFRAEVKRRNRTLKMSVEYRTTHDRAAVLSRGLVPGTFVQIKGELWNETIGEGEGAKRFLLFQARVVQRLALETPDTARPKDSPSPINKLPSFFGDSLPS